MLFNLDSAEYLTKFRAELALDLDSVHNANETQCAYRKHILSEFDKKFVLGATAVDTEAEALKKFLSVNSRMASVNSHYQSDPAYWSSNNTLLNAKKFVARVLGPAPTSEQVFNRAKHSGGVTIGVKFIDTSLEAKMRFPLSCTRPVAALWEHFKSWDFLFYSQAWNLSENQQKLSAEFVTIEGSRMTTVPKTNKIDRVIAVEPTINMFFQQGLAALMNERLVQSGLSVKRDQELHRRLAYQGSITDDLCTIDFSSMSDSLSLAICHFLLPREWYHWLVLLRSPRTLVKGRNVDLAMMSSMGNATTFPLETLILYAIGTAANAVASGFENLPWDSDPFKIRVYGDDCIIRRSGADLFIETCNIAGFVVNSSKTFLDGPFRESCGGDFYRGRDVRPFYLKSLPAEAKRISREAYLYDTLNGVLRMYIKYFGTATYLYDKRLLRFLFRLLNQCTKHVKFVPEDFPTDSGLVHLREIGRFTAAYRITISEILVNDHGVRLFAYLRYRYPETGAIHEGLRYAYGLRHAKRSEEDSETIRPERKGGFYIKGTGRSLTVTPTTEAAFARPTSKGWKDTHTDLRAFWEMGFPNMVCHHSSPSS